MPTHPQLIRLIEIDRRIRAGEYPSPDNLAACLGVKRRVIFKDRAFLINSCGAPLAFCRKRGGWYYREKTWALPAVVVSRGEMLAFLLAVEAAQRQLGPVLEAELQDAVAKLGRAMSGAVSVDFEQLRRHLTFTAPVAATTDSGVLMALKDAIESRRCVSMRYFNAHRNREDSRRVHPYHLYHSNGDWYLINYDLGRDAYRTFNVARISHLQVEEKTFVRKLDFDAEQYLRAGFRTEIGSQVFDVVIRFDKSQAPYARERTYHSTQSLEEMDDGGVILRFQSSGLTELVRWILQFGPHAEVIGPKELRNAVKTAVGEMVGVYGEGVGE